MSNRPTLELSVASAIFHAMAKRTLKPAVPRSGARATRPAGNSSHTAGRWLFVGIALALAAVPLWIPVANFVTSLRSGTALVPRHPAANKRDLMAQVDGKRMYDFARALVALGPRVPGSPAHETARDIMTSDLEKSGLLVRRQIFHDQNGDTDLEFTNMIARVKEAPPSSGRIHIVARYDSTNLPNVELPAAQSAAAGPALLCEVARIIANAPGFARRVDFVLLDGSSPYGQFGADDGLRGSRTHSASLVSGPSAGSDSVIVLHALGGHDGRLTVPARVSRSLLAACKHIVADHRLPLELNPLDRPIWDDDLPYLATGRKVLLLSNADSPELGTADDTLSTLSPEHLAATAQLVILLLTEMQ